MIHDTTLYMTQKNQKSIHVLITTLFNYMIIKAIRIGNKILCDENVSPLLGSNAKHT